MATLVCGLGSVVYERIYFRVHDFVRAGARARGVLESIC